MADAPGWKTHLAPVATYSNGLRLVIPGGLGLGAYDLSTGKPFNVDAEFAFDPANPNKQFPTLSSMTTMPVQSYAPNTDSMFDKFMQMAIPAGIGLIGAGALSGGFGGMFSGGAGSAAAPGTLLPEAGAGLGNVTGLAGAGGLNPFSSLMSTYKGLPIPLRSALTNSVISGIRGGNPLAGALSGGLGGLGGMLGQMVGLPYNIGSFLTKTGYGAFNASNAADEYRNRAQQMQLLRAMRQRGPFPQSQA